MNFILSSFNFTFFYSTPKKHEEFQQGNTQASLEYEKQNKIESGI